MQHRTLKEKWEWFLSEIKKHPLYACLGVILLICFLIFAYTHPLNGDYKSGRTVLPQMNAPVGTFTLVTEPEQGIAPVLTMIKNASHSIDLVMYELEDKDIADALIAAQKRGVAVRVLVNQGYYGKEEKVNEPAYAYLSSASVAVHFTPSYFALTHQKTLVVDQKQALIMTFNFSPQYYATGRDFGIVDDDTHDVQAIEKTFDADWQNQQITKQNGDDLVWSPGSDQDMLLIINSAKKELDIYNEEMADTRIIDALTAAIKRGVAVNIVMTYQSIFKTEFNQLKTAGAQLHLFHGTKGMYIHAKMILADQAYAFLGSENFSYGSLNQNRELGIFLSDPAVTQSLFNTFNTDWVNAQNF